MKFILTLGLFLLTLLSVFLPYLMLFPLWGTPTLTPQETGAIPLWGQLFALLLFWSLFFLSLLERRNFPEKKVQNWGLLGLACYSMAALLLAFSAGGLQVLNPLVWGIIVLALLVLTCLSALAEKKAKSADRK